ncbi:gamma-glutamyl-gamma-aminobutyrate hydrolase family protein [Amycolatopsis sp. H6(2020)]|nr:gamma-glutamyl-gamma-aminobutyrate hydrolase family protein [Amycolatopsis sp. H6(2020)]
MPRFRSVVVLHHPDDSTGCLMDIAPELGLELSVTTVDALPDPAEVEHAIVLGSPESAYDERLPWLVREQAWLRALITASVPVFGICFGSQALARALGGIVHRNHVPEIGWTPVDTSDPDLVAPGPWMNFHFDAFTVPPAATSVATTQLAPQAYLRDRCMGVQFHPEITEGMFRSWLSAWGSSPASARMLAELGDLPDRLLAELIQRGETNTKACFALLDGFLSRVAQR